MENTYRNNNKKKCSNKHGKCGNTSFKMSAVVSKNAPMLIRNNAQKGKLKLKTHQLPINKGDVVTITFNGLLELKNYLEYGNPSCIYFPGPWMLNPSWGYSETYRMFMYKRNKPAVIVFETYGIEGSHEAIWAKLCTIDPNLIGVGYLAAPAPTNSGYRFYCLVENGNSIVRYGPLFAMRLWIHGLSGVRQVKPGKYAIREYVNAEAFNPDYLLSEAPASLGQGIIQVKAPIEFRPGGLLNTRSFPYLSESEKNMVVNNCAQAIARCPLSDDAASARASREIWKSVSYDAQEGGE